MEKQKRLGDFIRTYTGKMFWPLDARPEEVDIVDIAHSLSNMCRFAGHTKEFYSVAQHSIHVAFAVMREMPDRPDVGMSALLHDASEAYIMDIPSPVKKHLHEYKAIEAKLMSVIDRAFGVPSYHDFPIIKEMDIRTLATEQRDLMLGSTLDGVPFDYKIDGWPAGITEHRFLSHFRYISEKLDEYRKAHQAKNDGA